MNIISVIRKDNKTYLLVNSFIGEIEDSQIDNAADNPSIIEKVIQYGTLFDERHFGGSEVIKQFTTFNSDVEDILRFIPPFAYLVYKADDDISHGVVIAARDAVTAADSFTKTESVMHGDQLVVMHDSVISRFTVIETTIRTIIPVPETDAGTLKRLINQ